MAAKKQITIKRGLSTSLKDLTLLAGEQAFTTDSKKLYIGDGADKICINPDAEKVGTAGTYVSVTTDAEGRVVAGASKLTLDQLPHGALERCVVVANEAARKALTTAQAQTGDTIKVSESGKMYFVVDDTKLNTDEGYEVYTAGSAASVPWSGVTDKPQTLAAYGFTDTKTAFNQDFGTNAPLANGTAAAGTATNVSREDHIHPTDTSRAPLESPALTGTPTAPKADIADKSNILANTDFVQSLVEDKLANLVIDCGTF